MYAVTCHDTMIRYSRFCFMKVYITLDVPQTPKLRVRSVDSPELSNVLSFKHGVRQNIALRASPAARILAISASSVHSSSVSFKSSLRFGAAVSATAALTQDSGGVAQGGGGLSLIHI